MGCLKRVTLAFLMMVGFAGLASAEESGSQADNKSRKPSKEQVLERFDVDGDRELSAEEREAVRKARAAARNDNKEGNANEVPTADDDGDGKGGDSGATGRNGHGGAKGKNGHGGAKGENGHGGAKGENGHGGAKGENGHGGAKGENGHGGAKGKNGHGGTKGENGNGGATGENGHGEDKGPNK